MRTIVVSDERMEIVSFQFEVRNFREIKIVGTFEDDEEAMRFARKHEIDLAIINASMNGKDGILLGSRLREIFPDILLIFFSNVEQYAIQATRLRAVAFLIKPYTNDELFYALESARLLSRRRKKRRIYVKTFGHFDLFIDDQPIMFRSGKAKELLALLVDRQGGTVNTDQGICALWEERPNDEATQNLCSKVSRNLLRELEEYGIKEILIAERGVRRVDTELFECDLYDFLAGEEKARKQFAGEYMSDYSWAEERVGQLLRYASE